MATEREREKRRTLLTGLFCVRSSKTSARSSETTSLASLWQNGRLSTSPGSSPSAKAFVPSLKRTSFSRLRNSRAIPVSFFLANVRLKRRFFFVPCPLIYWHACDSTQDGTATWRRSSCSFISYLRPQKGKGTAKSAPPKPLSIFLSS